jgi:hypothetical protein
VGSGQTCGSTEDGKEVSTTALMRLARRATSIAKKLHSSNQQRNWGCQRCAQIAEYSRGVVTSDIWNPRPVSTRFGLVERERSNWSALKLIHSASIWWGKALTPTVTPTLTTPFETNTHGVDHSTCALCTAIMNRRCKDDSDTTAPSLCGLFMMDEALLDPDC